MASKKKLAARRANAKRDQSPKPKGKSPYALKRRRGPSVGSPFYHGPNHPDNA